MFTRNLENYINSIKPKYRCITLIGPRQSGKTTLSRKLFAGYEYYSFESPDIRQRAVTDPRSFLSGLKSDVIIDEVQKFPDILSYLQEILDDKKDQRRFVLTGSNSLLLSEKISQSLAGRTRIIQVLPLTPEELPLKLRPATVNEALWKGLYPRIYDQDLNPREWFGDYLQTYIEKDVRSLLNISDLITFERFLRLVAGRVGQILNYNNLASDVGIGQPTAKNWLSVLEASFVSFTLAPHFNNFSKRIIKSPKVYFYDTGLLCYLLRIENSSQLATHPQRGSIFENYIVSESHKYFFNQGQMAPLYFWRDQHGHEVDLVIDKGVYLDLVEIKSGQTFHPSFYKNITWLNKLQNRTTGAVIYGGEEQFESEKIKIYPWNKFNAIF